LASTGTPDGRARTRGRFRIRDGVQAQIQDMVPGMQPVLGDVDQHRELDLVVRRAHVLHDPTDPAALLHDLHRSGTRGRLHLPDEPRHPHRLPISAPKRPPTEP
jgi:hypothetical protein